MSVETVAEGNGAALEMSDEDIMNMTPEQFAEQMGGTVEHTVIEETPQNEVIELTEEDIPNAPTDNTDDSGTVVDTDSPEDASAQDDAESEAGLADDGHQGEGEDGESDGEEVETSPEAQSQLDKLFAPFKANGKDLQVTSVDEAITLMQRGANYNKKMAQLKPGFKVLKMLENNGLLDETKLSYLIDLDKKNPDAVAKFIKDSGVDLVNFDTEKEVKYAPENHSVTDSDMALDEVLDELRDTPTYQATMEVVGKQWDDSSKSKLVAQPSLIRGINEQMSNGMYEMISNEVNRERAFGRLTGLSDFDAYVAAGDKLFREGKFGATQQGQPQQPAQQAPVQAKQESTRKDKKRAASSTRGNKKPTSPSVENILGMSDEDFMKQINDNSLF